MGQRESKSGEVRLSLSGPETVHDATRAARAFAVNADLDHTAAAHLCIIVEELVTNLYDHGELTAADVVDLTLAATATGVRLSLTDSGKRFDPRRAEADSPTPDRGGGAGLKLLHSWAREINYRVIDGRNHLTLLLPAHRGDR